MPNLPTGVWLAIIVAVAAALAFALYKGAGLSLRLGKVFRADVARSSDLTVSVANDLDAAGAEIGNIAGVRGDARGVRSAEVAARAHLKKAKVGDITGVDTRIDRDQA